MGWALPRQSLMRKMPHRQTNLLEANPQLRLSLPTFVYIYVKLSKINQYKQHREDLKGLRQAGYARQVFRLRGGDRFLARAAGYTVVLPFTKAGMQRNRSLFLWRMCLQDIGDMQERLRE